MFMIMHSHEFHMMQLADSFFPSGTFGFSGGLESFVKSGRIKDKKGVLLFIRQQLEFQIMPCDCVVLSAVMSSATSKDIDGIVRADSRYYAMKLVREMRTASTRSGKQILQTLAHIKINELAKEFRIMIDQGKSPGTYPACLAMAAYSLQIPAESAVRIMLYTYCSSIVGSAVRLGTVSHIEGQRVLCFLAQDVSSATPKRDLDDLWQLSPLAEILQMRHEQDEFRMFIT
jgi:urease accessory protein